jgi:hypothetical protein
MNPALLVCGVQTSFDMRRMEIMVRALPLEDGPSIPDAVKHR